MYTVEDDPEKASAKAKAHTKPSFLSFLGDKCFKLLGGGGEEGRVRDQEEKEEGGTEEEAATEACSLRAGADWKTGRKVQRESWSQREGQKYLLGWAFHGKLTASLTLFHM